MFKAVFNHEKQELEYTQTEPLTILALPGNMMELNRLIMSSGNVGLFLFRYIRTVVLVPAGGTAQVNLAPVSRYVAMPASPMMATSDFYDPLLWGLTTIDGTPASTPVALTEPAIISGINIGLIGAVRNNMQVALQNDTVTDATVTITTEIVEIDEGYFQDIYMPIFEKVAAEVEEFAGAGRVDV